jgi:predicted CXXCH cytochrome family protein
MCHAPHSTALESLKFMNQGKVGQLCENCHDALSGVVK